MKDIKDTPYNQSVTHNVDVKYDFMFDREKRDLFTKEQVSSILDRIESALMIYDEEKPSKENAQDVIDWVKRDVLRLDN